MKPSISRGVSLLALIIFSAGCSTMPVSPHTVSSFTFNVRDYGATGDGKTIDSPAINKAIDAAAAAGGGTVYFPAGTYASFSIHLKSHIVLRLDAGATILAAEPPADLSTGYDAPEPNPGADQYEDFGHSHWHNSLIWGENLEDVSIIGPGLIFGRGLSRGGGRRDLTPEERKLPKDQRPDLSLPKNSVVAEKKGPFGYPGRDVLPAGVGNKSIALKNCHNVTFRDFSIFHGGHFGILVTGVDNLTMDNLKIDTNRDGMDIDCCLDVHVSHCSVNSPWDDGICLKASYGLGALRPCSNITISDCYLTGGYDEGSLLDGTFRRSAPSYNSHHMGRIKLGTESNGDFKNIAIANCVFDDCMGIAIESVDGSHIEDVAITNITMRRVAGSPIFIRLGNRARGPGNPPVGTIRRVSIDNLVASGADWRYGSIVSGIPGHPVEDLRMSNIHIEQAGGGGAALVGSTPPEAEAKYPEPSMFGSMPSYGFFLRHVSGVEMSHVKLDFASPEARPAFVLADVVGARLDHVDAMRGAGGAALFELRRVSDFCVTESAGVADTRLPGAVEAARY